MTQKYEQSDKYEQSGKNIIFPYSYSLIMITINVVDYNCNLEIEINIDKRDGVGAVWTHSPRNMHKLRISFKAIICS